MKKLLPLSLLFLGIMGGARAQTCGTTITAFPYIENFDGASAPGWTSGGTNSSWALGTPAKTVINSAASGTKSWVTNLSGNYNASEQSFVESPCFNMSSLILPVIEMKIWWNSEFSFDGAVLQSSIDGGTTWQNVGVKGDPNNWYNDNTINGGPGGQPAASAQGWTGRNLTVNGSGGWVTAKHDLTGLGGKPNVKLRIAFASDGIVHDEGFAFDNFTIYDTPANDAGVTSITSPVSPVIPGSPQPVSVTVKNYGTNPLTSATFGFSVNGVVQPTFPWTGNVATNATSAPIQIGTFSFPAGTQKIKAWSKLPNAAPDGNPGNDSTQLIINSCNPLTGNFTINKNVAASATNFTSFGAAATLLGNCGVSGPVTFSVAPNSGPYNEQVILPAIPGTSAANTVTFEGNGNTVTATTGTILLGIVTFNGADFVRVNNFKLDVDANASSGWGVQLLNASDNNTITNCTINLPLNNPNSTLNGIIAGSSTVTTAGNYANNLLVQNNIINGGYYGIVLNGVTTGTPTSGNRIIGNQVKDAVSIGIYLSNAGTGTLVEGNDISRPNRIATTGLYGIYLVGNNINTIVSKNRFHNTHDAASTTNGTVYGIYTLSAATPGNENIIKNNLIYNVNNNGGIFYGLFGVNSSNTFFYHNTVSADNPGVTYNVVRGLSLSTSGTNIKFQNNIVSLASPATTKHAIYLSATTIGLSSNYNNIYIGSSGNIGYYGADKATLTDWKAANSNAYDQNSVSVDPLFMNGTYLQPLAIALDNIGTPVTPAVSDDINGLTRSTTTPDPGAYEFTPAANDAGVTAIVSPTSPVMPGSQPVQVNIRNFGIAALTSATIGWSVNGAVQPNFGWTGNLASLQATTTPVNIGSYNFTGGNYTIKAWAKLPNGAADQLAANDTTILRVISCAPLAGNYTVNKNNPASATNFQSLTEIAQRLSNCGVSAPVTVTVASGTGPYTEQVEIGKIPNTSATNTVTFEGNGNTVTTTPGLRPGIFVLNGTKYTKLNNFVITLPSTATTGWGVQLINAADFNTISNNTINLGTNSTSLTINGIITGATTGAVSNNASNLRIQNNIINGGAYAIQINGNTGGLNADNIQITGNQFRDQQTYGVNLNNANGTLVENNDFSRPTRTNATSFYGLYINGTCLNSVISKNRIHNTHDAATLKTGTVYGIYLTASATTGNENIIKNNLIYNINNNGGSFYGIYNSGGNGNYYYHNTVATDPATSYVTLRGIYIVSTVTNVKFVNNIISLPSTGTTKHGIYLSSATASVISDNNDLFVGTISGIIGYCGGDKATLADWKAVNNNAFDQNSVATDPAFVNYATSNLKPAAAPLDNAGKPIAAVTDDFAGATRNTTTPDIGAYEFGVPANDVGILAVSGSNASGCGLTATESVSVILKNFGASTQTTIPVSYSLNGVAIAAPETWTGSMTPGDTAIYTFTAKANLATSGTYQIIAKTMLGGDITTSNDPDTLSMVNSLITGTPAPFDFETAATGISKFRNVTNTKSNITEGTGASFGATSTKGMILDGIDNTGWATPTGVTDPWSNNPDNFAGAYICVTPANFAFPDSLWLTFDLKQLFKTANANTNFRVTLNGTQAGPTYRPPFSGTPINWQKIKVDLTAYKNDPTVMIALESSVKEAYANGTGTANLIDNIEFKRHVAQVVSGIYTDILQSQIHVFPNPSNGQFHIDLPAGKTYQLEVTDLTGKVILKQAAKGNAKLNLEGTAKGIYLLKVSGENGSAVRKLIVE